MPLTKYKFELTTNPDKSVNYYEVEDKEKGIVIKVDSSAGWKNTKIKMKNDEKGFFIVADMYRDSDNAPAIAVKDIADYDKNELTNALAHALRSMSIRNVYFVPSLVEAVTPPAPTPKGTLTSARGR
jgi:hypothetical protein